MNISPSPSSSLLAGLSKHLNSPLIASFIRPVSRKCIKRESKKARKIERFEIGDHEAYMCRQTSQRYYEGLSSILDELQMTLLSQARLS